MKKEGLIQATTWLNLKNMICQITKGWVGPCGKQNSNSLFQSDVCEHRPEILGFGWKRGEAPNNREHESRIKQIPGDMVGGWKKGILVNTGQRVASREAGGQGAMDAIKRCVLHSLGRACKNQGSAWIGRLGAKGCGRILWLWGEAWGEVRQL